MREILVIEDRTDLRELVVELFADAGFAVRSAPDGLRGLGLLREKRPDAVLLDRYMPVMDGEELLREMGRDPSLAEVPVVLLSAAPQERPPGAAALVVKPFDPFELVALVERLVGHA